MKNPYYTGDGLRVFFLYIRNWHVKVQQFFDFDSQGIFNFQAIPKWNWGGPKILLRVFPLKYLTILGLIEDIVLRWSRNGLDRVILVGGSVLVTVPTGAYKNMYIGDMKKFFCLII